MKLTDFSKIHFIGIGGIGNSGLARILNKKGIDVSGSDKNQSNLTEEMTSEGIKISIGHNKENIKNHDLIIYSPAIPKNNIELKAANLKKIKTLTYPEALGLLTKELFTIAVAGTHGKSTTTAMISKIFIEANKDPSIVIGTKMKELNGANFRAGKSDILIMEACEYKDSFQNFEPDILVITNIEPDHLDYFKTEENYYQAFIKLFNKLKNSTIISENTKLIQKLSQKSLATKIFYNKKDNSDILLQNKALTYRKNKLEIKPEVAGEFNVENATKAALAALQKNIKIQQIEKSIANFSGTWRRMEYKKTKFSKIFIDDYAHHPTEIKKTLKAIKEKYPNKKTLCIFQPHQYSRTFLLLDEFAKSFKDTNQVIITDIYSVRDSKKDQEKINSTKLVQEINKNSNNAIHISSIKKAAQKIIDNKEEFDIIITMGAGDISNIYSYL